MQSNEGGVQDAAHNATAALEEAIEELRAQLAKKVRLWGQTTIIILC